MAFDWCSVSAPANARLMGEHAVLRGGPSLVFSLHPRIRIEAQKREDLYVHVDSKFGKESFLMPSDASVGDHRFIKAALQVCLPFFSSGLNIKVINEFEHTVGLGSSAAVTAATIASCQLLSYGKLDLERCLTLSQQAIRLVQGEGSGADAAASIYGGVLVFYSEGCRVRRLKSTIPLFLAYSGMKTPTKEVISYVRRFEAEEPELSSFFFHLINSITEKSIDAILKEDWRRLGVYMNQAHGCMVGLGLENSSLATVRAKLLTDSNVYGCKIAGSGLGDCVVAVGENICKESLASCLPWRSDGVGLRIEQT